MWRLPCKGTPFRGEHGALHTDTCRISTSKGTGVKLGSAREGAWVGKEHLRGFRKQPNDRLWSAAGDGSMSLF